MLQIYKDSKFNNTKIKNSKIQVQNKTQTLRKSFLSKVCTRRGHININNNNDDNNDNIMIILIIYIYIYIYIKLKKRKEREREKKTIDIFEA